MKFNLKTTLLIVFTLVINNNIASAHHGGEAGLSGPGLSGPIVTIPARTLPKGKKFFTLGATHTIFDTFSTSEIGRLDRRGEHIHEPRGIFTPSLSFGYGITDNLFFALNVPYVFRFDVRTGLSGMGINQGNSIGVGDISLFTQYRFLKNEKHDLHLAFLSGVKIPSGVRRETDDFGNLYEADDQPGTGSWDPLLGLSITKGFKSFSFDANGLYKLSTQGIQNTTVGDLVTFNTALSKRVKKQIES